MCWLFTHCIFTYIYVCVLQCMGSVCVRNRSAEDEDDHPTAWWPAGREQFKIVQAPRDKFGFTFPYIYWHLMTSLYIALPCFLMFSCCARSGPERRVRAPNRAPKEAFGPRKSIWQVRICSLSLSINFLLHVRTSPYISIHLFTLFFHVLLRCLFGPRKRSLGPESGPERGVRAPKEHLTSSDLLSLSLLYIYIFPFTCPYISIHLYTSLYLFFPRSLVLPLRAPKEEFGPRIGPRKRRSGPERAFDKFGFALSLSLYI